MTVITSLFSVFSHVNTVNVVPDQNLRYHNIGLNTKNEIKGGIMCKPEGITSPNEETSQSCADITPFLYNISLSETEYQCYNNTILYHTTLLHISNKVRNVYILIIVFTGLFNMFAVIHDCGLINWYTKRNGLKKVIFFPTENDMRITRKVWNRIKKPRILCCLLDLLLWIVPLILGILVDLFITFVVDVIRSPFKHTFYISAIAAGFCRLMMIIMISFYSFFACEFDVLLDYSDDPCYCYCVYYLNQHGMYI